MAEGLMLIGIIKTCHYCGKENYVRAGEETCPECNEVFGTYKTNKAPAGWVKKENYEISRDTVGNMLKDGTLTKKDLR